MKRIYLFSLVLSLTICSASAQVGINTTTPNSHLDVVGDVKTDQSLYLENPGDNTQIRDSKLLIQTTGNEIINYDIAISKYGPINYAEFVFENLDSSGLQDYDTKISTNDYIVVVQGYYFLDSATGIPEVVLYSANSTSNVEGYQIYSYKNTSTNTWFIKGFANDSTFRIYDFLTNSYIDTNVDLYLNVVIYRKGFISKELTEMTIDMGGLNKGVATLPIGF
ncbi:MAG: hypothetical protein K0U54_08000 [Bacteroidetes bacterium]|nr:hypothetical protein [Bacteroidota bacterium]